VAPSIPLSVPTSSTSYLYQWVAGTAATSADPYYQMTSNPMPHRDTTYSSLNDSVSYCSDRRDNDLSLHNHQHFAPQEETNADKGDDSSLGTLAKRFFNLLKDYGDEELDLNEAADALSVRKRRIYDVTNVMEGIGLIEKRNKNKVAYCVEDHEAEIKYKRAMERELEDLELQLEPLDHYIKEVQKTLKNYTSSNASDISNASSKLFVRSDEIRSLKTFVNDTVIAIRAPPTTSLSVPNPDNPTMPGMRKFQIHLASSEKNKVFIDCIKVETKMDREWTRCHSHIGGESRNDSCHASQNYRANLEIPKFPDSSISMHTSGDSWKSQSHDKQYPVQEQRTARRNRSNLQTRGGSQKRKLPGESAVTKKGSSSVTCAMFFVPAFKTIIIK